MYAIGQHYQRRLFFRNSSKITFIADTTTQWIQKVKYFIHICVKNHIQPHNTW